MSATIEIVDKQDYVWAIYVGDFSVKDARSIIDKIIEFIPENVSRTVLLDCSRMTGALSVIDIFQTAQHGQKILGRVSKIALVRPPERAEADRFTETASANRGINLRLFSDSGEAIEWLKSQPG